MMVIDMESPGNAINSGLMEITAKDLIEVIERIGPPIANDLKLESITRLANIIGEEETRFYENASLKEYTSLISASRFLDKPLVISGVKMNWSSEHKAWYNSTKLGISNIRRNDINAKLDGFIEIKKDDTGSDVVNIFIQAAPSVWYYFGYSAGQLIAYSSNPEFNEAVTGKSNINKAKPGELVMVVGGQNETLTFINEFREKYFGITEPYNLEFPDEINLENEEFKTIEEDDDDDGFGFN
jgi:hypothetical protein